MDGHQAAPGFNEARADSPGEITTEPGDTMAAAPTASMRPGPIRPGDHGEEHGEEQAHALQ